MINLYVKGIIMKERIIEALKTEDGLGTIEIAIIIIILIGLALLFREEITEVLEDMLKEISNEAPEVEY